MSDDPVLLITGASSGIGAATARAAASKYRLVLAARRLEPLEELVAELGGEERALAVRCDVAEWGQVEAMAAAAIERFGRIDVVFANAGFGASRGFLEESPEHWRSMVLTNVYGVGLTIRATLPHLLERGDSDRRGAARGTTSDPREPRHPRHLDRAGHDRHALL